MDPHVHAPLEVRRQAKSQAGRAICVMLLGPARESGHHQNPTSTSTSTSTGTGTTRGRDFAWAARGTITPFRGVLVDVHNLEQQILTHCPPFSSALREPFEIAVSEALAHDAGLVNYLPPPQDYTHDADLQGRCRVCWTSLPPDRRFVVVGIVNGSTAPATTTTTATSTAEGLDRDTNTNQQQQQQQQQQQLMIKDPSDDIRRATLNPVRANAPPPPPRGYCSSCARQRESNVDQTCPVCRQVWQLTDKDMAQCDGCHGWVHARCDSRAEALLTQTEGSLAATRYFCTKCRQDREISQRKTALARLHAEMGLDWDENYIQIYIPEETALITGRTVSRGGWRGRGGRGGRGGAGGRGRTKRPLNVGAVGGWEEVWRHERVVPTKGAARTTRLGGGKGEGTGKTTLLSSGGGARGKEEEEGRGDSRVREKHRIRVSRTSYVEPGHASSRRP